MNDQTIVALAGIASATVLTPLITAFLARRMFRVQRAAERESAEFIDVRKRESDDLVQARRITMDFATSVVEFWDVYRRYTQELERAAAHYDGTITEGLR
jgi:hypothetical protein